MDVMLFEKGIFEDIIKLLLEIHETTLYYAVDPETNGYCPCDEAIKKQRR